MVKGTDVVAHPNYMKTIAEWLDAVEDPVSDRDLVIIFSSLPGDYDHLITTLEALDENQCKLTWNYVRDRKGVVAKSSVKDLSDQEALYSGGKKGGRYQKKFNHMHKNKESKNTQNGGKRCFPFDGLGHFMKKCPKKKSEEAVYDFC